MPHTPSQCYRKIHDFFIISCLQKITYISKLSQLRAIKNFKNQVDIVSSKTTVIFGFTENGQKYASLKSDPFLDLICSWVGSVVDCIIFQFPFLTSSFKSFKANKVSLFDNYVNNFYTPSENCNICFVTKTVVQKTQLIWQFVTKPQMLKPSVNDLDDGQLPFRYDAYVTSSADVLSSWKSRQNLSFFHHSYSLLLIKCVICANCFIQTTDISQALV